MSFAVYARKAIISLVGGAFILSFLIMTVFFVAGKIYEADSFFIEASGAKGRVEQIVFLKEALRYEMRAFMHGKGDKESWSPTKQVHGNMRGLYEDGTLEYVYYKDNKALVKQGELINLNLGDNRSDVARKIQDLRRTQATFEIYKNGEVLVWTKDQPFNLLLIRAGLAKPHPNPPTNVVDRLFAEYYWNLLEEK